MYGNSPYYYPEKFDLVPVGEIEMSEPCYSFDTVVVWRHTPTGDVYTARDSGPGGARAAPSFGIISGDEPTS